MAFSSDCKPAGTWVVHGAWNGASTAPPLAIVPTYVPPLKLPFAALSTAAFTAEARPFSTLVMKYLQYVEALTHPSVSTQYMYTFLPLASAVLTAAAVPRPSPPATGKMMSAPWLMNVLAIRCPAPWSPNGFDPPTKMPFWVFSFQPSTWTCLWFFWL